MVWGNHDNPRIQKDMFDWVGKRFELDTPRGRILMRHQPNNLELWDKSAHDVIEGEAGFDWFLCGHVHDRWKRIGNVINVGVDVRDWEPKTLDELLAE
jgi:calcineurin-like phosphoesterase family protein